LEIFQLFPKFSMCSSRVFLIAPNVKPICFAQNPPRLTYIAGVFIARGNSPGKKCDEPFRGEKFYPTNGKSNHALRVPWFFSFQVLGLGLGSWRLEGRFFCSSCILFGVDSG
jgi:hypothetical protein